MTYTPPSPSEIAELALHGMSVFTTITVKNKTVLGLSLHLKRLQNDSHWLLGKSCDVSALPSLILSYLDQNQLKETVLRITIFPKSFSLTDPQKQQPLKILITHRDVPKQKTYSPLCLQTVESVRPFAQHKTGNLSVGMYSRMQAKKNGFDDALLIHQGNILEGPTWNILFQKGNSFFTPPSTSSLLLPGITLQILKKNLPESFLWKEEHISHTTLDQFDHAFVTSSVVGAVPVSRIITANHTFLFETNPQSIISECFKNAEGEVLKHSIL